MLKNFKYSILLICSSCAIDASGAYIENSFFDSPSQHEENLIEYYSEYPVRITGLKGENVEKCLSTIQKRFTIIISLAEYIVLSNSARTQFIFYPNTVINPRFDDSKKVDRFNSKYMLFDGDAYSCELSDNEVSVKVLTQ